MPGDSGREEDVTTIMNPVGNKPRADSMMKLIKRTAPVLWFAVIVLIANLPATAQQKQWSLADCIAYAYKNNVALNEFLNFRRNATFFVADDLLLID